jgi:hypothetical protein
MPFTADAFMGILIGLMFFALGVTTTVLANRGKPTTVYGTDANGEPTSSPSVIRDTPNIIFGSIFIIMSVTILAMTGRAVFS